MFDPDSPLKPSEIVDSRWDLEFLRRFITAAETGQTATISATNVGSQIMLGLSIRDAASNLTTAIESHAKALSQSATAAESHAKGLKVATWALVGATIALVLISLFG